MPLQEPHENAKCGETLSNVICHCLRDLPDKRKMRLDILLLQTFDHSQLRSRTEVFPLAFSIRICLCITTVALVVACSSRIRPSLADGIHLQLMSVYALDV